MVEDQIHEEEVVADSEALLAGLEAETAPQLQQELLHFVYQGLLQSGLGHRLARSEADELEHVGITDSHDAFRATHAFANFLR